MILKASLHIHTKEDRKDGHMIAYDVYQLIDEARRCGFRVLGFTPHQKYVFKEEYAEYARKKGIILIPGVERNLGRVTGKHVIILNCDQSIEKVRNFKQLIEYKKQHPDIFILSPHPTYSRIVSIGVRNLRKYISVFDAVEHSWLYSIRMNRNLKAEKIAREHNKPMIATADVHVLKKLDTDYSLIEADEFTRDGVLRAIKQGNFENVTFPKKYIDLIFYLIWTILKYAYKYFEQKILLLGVRKLLFERVKSED